MTTIDRVIRVPVHYDDMTRIWNSQRNNDFWADLDFIEENNLTNLITPRQLQALKNNEVDFIAFYDEGDN